MGKLISIIIPHKNSLETLKELLHTAPNRKDIEIIIVDDHSEERIQEQLLSEVQYISPNIRVIMNETEVYSAGKARNLGLKFATGKWIIFADADDLFTENFVTAIEDYKDSDLEAIYFRPLISGERSGGYSRMVEVFDIYQKEPSYNNLLLVKLRMDVPWSKMVRRSFIEENNIFFDEVIKNNDTMFSKKLAILSKNVAISDLPIYTYEVLETGITSNRTLATDLCRMDVQSRAYALQVEYYGKKRLLDINPEVLYSPIILIYAMGRELGAKKEGKKIYFKNAHWRLTVKSIIWGIRGYLRAKKLFK